MSIKRRPLDLLVRRLAQYTPLDEQDRHAILELPCAVRVLEPATYVIREGDPPQMCGVLVSGFAFRQKMTGDGGRQIVAVQIPGDALDLQHLYVDVADHSIQALTRAEVALIPRPALQELARTRPAVRNAIAICILIEASIFREWVLNVGRRDARTRMAHLLCEFAVRLEAQGLADEYGYELPMTQDQLADATGLTPVHVNRTLKALEADGLITRNRRHVSFPDWERMRDAADFTQRYLHLGLQGDGTPI